jgi:two-component system chemotaxis response regulator CheY
MNKRILVVDDEALIAESIASILESTGLYDVETTTDAYEAFERASSKAYDLVISDLMMPGMNGDTLYLCLGIHPEDPGRIVPRPKLLLISGVADEESMQRTRSFIGASGILQKPFTPESLARRVHRLMWPDEAPLTEGDTAWGRFCHRLAVPALSGKW